MNYCAALAYKIKSQLEVMKEELYKDSQDPKEAYSSSHNQDVFDEQVDKFPHEAEVEASAKNKLIHDERKVDPKGQDHIVTIESASLPALLAKEFKRLLIKIMVKIWAMMSSVNYQ